MPDLLSGRIWRAHQLLRAKRLLPGVDGLRAAVDGQRRCDAVQAFGNCLCHASPPAAPRRARAFGGVDAPRSAGAQLLTLAELDALAGAGAAVLLALHHA